MKNKVNVPNIALIIFAVVAAVLIFVCGAIGVSLANRTFVPEAAPENAMKEFVGVTDSNAQQSEAYYEELRNMKDLQNLVSTWATINNDAKMHLSTVTTYLLVVKEAGTVDTNYGNAEIISLVSVNTDAKKVGIVALDNDCLVYINLSDSEIGVNGPVYAKLNAAYANGGVKMLEKTIENNFKIEIDHYLVTDMAGVEAVAEELGGINVNVSDEVRTMVSEDFGVALPADNAALDGKQTVAYLREKRDGAESRINRQSDALLAAVKTAQKLGFGDAFGLVKVLAGVAKSDLAGGDLVSALRATLLGGWADYNVTAYTAPEEENAIQYKDSVWIRIIDIPVVAQSLQNKLFNKSNINLNANRVSTVELIAAVNKLYNDELAKLEAEKNEAVEDTTEGEEVTEGEDTTENEETTEREDVGTVG